MDRRGGDSGWHHGKTQAATSSSHSALSFVAMGGDGGGSGGGQGGGGLGGGGCGGGHGGGGGLGGSGGGEYRYRTPYDVYRSDGLFAPLSWAS